MRCKAVGQSAAVRSATLLVGMTPATHKMRWRVSVSHRAVPRRSVSEDHLRLACAIKLLATDNKTFPERRAYLPSPTNDRSHKSHARPLQEFGSPMTLISDLKARQAAKVREIGEALVTAGYDNLDAQAAALGLSRSTTWTIIRGTHKSSGLSAAILNRMLSAPDLHSLVRRKILEYTLENSAGLYGTPRNCQRRAKQGLGRAPKSSVQL